MNPILAAEVDRRVRRRSTVRRLATGVAAAVLVVSLLSGCQPTSGTYATPVDVYAHAVAVRSFPTVLGRPTGGGIAAWSAVVLEHPDAEWIATALIRSEEYRNGPGLWSDEAFIDQAYRQGYARSPTDEELLVWTTLLVDGPSARARFAGWVIETGFGVPLVRPSGVACAGYDRGGLAPHCTPGADGSPRTVLVQTIPGSNIITNVAWSRQVQSLVVAARSAGFTLGAHQDPKVPYPAGSWRSYEAQNWLYTHGYPANPPGRSMHEWGLAIDFSCDGASIVDRPACWNWVRANGPAFGVIGFATATRISSREAWHFSSNGR